jgi:hypothetical protein
MESVGEYLVEVTCSFCRGRGRDPFGIMSRLSTCCVCGGRGVVQMSTPYTRCALCRGTGAVKTFTCTVCRGTGFVSVIPDPLRLARSAGAPGMTPPRPWPAPSAGGEAWCPRRVMDDKMANPPLDFRGSSHSSYRSDAHEW